MKFSIIVPAYNGEKYIEETLDCLLSQTEQSVEVIVVNDGSTDKTEEIVKEYASRDERVVYVYQDNAGVSAARNNGIERARGEYVIFIDSDDLLSEDALEKIYEGLKAEDADLAIFRVQSFGDGLNQYNYIVDKLIQEKEINCYDMRLLRNFLVSNKAYRTELLQKSGVRFPPMKYSEDGAFFMEFVHTVKPKITGVKDALFMYRRHEGSVTHKVNSGLINEFSKSMDYIYDVAEKSFEDAPEKKENYLQEILFKCYLALMNEFYRMLWKANDDEALSVMGRICENLDAKMTDRTKRRCAQETRDIGKLYFSKEEIRENPVVSVVIKNPDEEFLKRIYLQTMPVFEIVSKKKDAKGIIAIKFRKKERPDPRLFKIAARLKRSKKFSFFPAWVIKIGATVFLKIYG